MYFMETMQFPYPNCSSRISIAFYDKKGVIKFLIPLFLLFYRYNSSVKKIFPVSISEQSYPFQIVMVDWSKYYFTVHMHYMTIIHFLILVQSYNKIWSKFGKNMFS